MSKDKELEKNKWQRFDLCNWEKEVLNEFNADDCIEDLLYFIPKENEQDFLSNLADSLFSFKAKAKQEFDKKISDLDKLIQENE